MIVLTDRLTKEYREGVKALLFAADREFVPPLSARSGTTQTELEQAPAQESGPERYFRMMEAQSFVIAAEDGQVQGFMSYIPDRELELDGRSLICDYVSTIVVSPGQRGRGLTGRMYRALISARPGKRTATRTWSENRAHLHLLRRLGFELAYRIPDDRGPGVDTVYYVHEAGPARNNAQEVCPEDLPQSRPADIIGQA